ncbi:MAG: ceramidase domain-containing protein [Bdellovibrionales bacterium]|nr:ceramidase domain-containing protein [Bdellovibrionales bacterium]
MPNNPHQPGCPWHLHAEVFGAPDIKYCEETLCQLISEPALTWTNLPIMVAGLWAVLYSKRSQNPWLKSLGLSVIAMGLLSFIYHLSNNFLTQVIDYLGMYFFVALVVLLGFLKIEKISTKTVVSAYLLGLIAFTVATVGFHFLGIPKQLIVLAGGLPIYLEYASYKKGSGLVRWLVFSLVFFVLALTSQILDVNRVFCDPQNHYFQMHMFWHLFNAVAIGFYLFYCSKLSADDYRGASYEEL